jgi:hypothetical protein
VSEPVARADGVTARSVRLSGAWRGAVGSAAGSWPWTPA